LLSYLEDRIGLELDAVITGVDRYGFFCRGIELPAEGLVHISTLPQRDIYDFDRTVMTLTGRRSGTVFRLGDRVRVRVTVVDVDRRELDFQLVSRQASAKGKRTLSRRSSTSRNPAAKNPAQKSIGVSRKEKAARKRVKRRRS